MGWQIKYTSGLYGIGTRVNYIGYLNGQIMIKNSNKMNLGGLHS